MCQYHDGQQGAENGHPDETNATPKWGSQDPSLCFQESPDLSQPTKCRLAWHSANLTTMGLQECRLQARQCQLRGLLELQTNSGEVKFVATGRMAESSSHLSTTFSKHACTGWWHKNSATPRGATIRREIPQPILGCHRQNG